MRREQKQEPKSLEMDAPKGMTVSVGEAARILGVSRSTLKRKSGVWGLTTFWDGRGRIYSVNELGLVEKGILEPKKAATVSLDFEEIWNYSPLPGGYRFRIYGGAGNRGYLGCFGSRDPGSVLQWLKETYGEGIYYLKLLGEGGRMTGYNFRVCIDDVDEDKEAEFAELRLLKTLSGSYRKMARQLKESSQNHET